MNVKQFNINLFIKQLILFFLGLWIIQIGVAIFIYISIGSDPFTLFTQGIANIMQITPGTANRILTFVLFIIVLMVDRKNINIGTLLSILFTGFFMDLMLGLYEGLTIGSLSMMIKVLIFGLGCLFVAIGFPILKAANLGVAPNDLVYLAIVDKSRISYSKVRMATDIVFCLIGLLLGGVLGLGTVLCVLLLGPLTQYFFPKVEKVTTQFLKE